MKNYFLMIALAIIIFSCSDTAEEVTPEIKKYSIKVENEEFFDFHSFSDILNKIILHDPIENLIYFFHRLDYDRSDVYILNYQDKNYYKKAIEADWILYGTHSLNYQLKEIYISYNGSLRVYDSITLELKEEYKVAGENSKVSGYGFDDIILVGTQNVLFIYRRSDKQIIDQVTGGNSLVQCFVENNTIYSFTGNIGSTPSIVKLDLSGQANGGLSLPPKSTIKRKVFSNEKASFVIGEGIIYNKWDLRPVDTLNTPSLNYVALSEDANSVYTVSEFNSLFEYDGVSFSEIGHRALQSTPRFVFYDEGKLIIVYQEGMYGNRVKLSIFDK